jgi:uncharacterized protein
VGPGEALAILGAGLASGTVNAVVGSGSLITFPTLLAFGIPPIVANVSNNVGQVPGNVSGAVGYRRELAGQWSRLVRLGVIAAVGSAGGAAALLSLPSSSFQVLVPALILTACALVLVQPWLSARIMARRAASRGGPDAAVRTAGRAPGLPAVDASGDRPADPPVAAGSGGQFSGPAGDDREALSPVLRAGVLASAAYGGYFGAAQGVLVIGLLGTFLDETLQRVNGAKNVLVAVVNGVAAIIYLFLAHIDWLVVLLIGVGSAVGGVLGARFGRRLSPLALRIFVVLIGVVSAVKLLFF